MDFLLLLGGLAAAGIVVSLSLHRRRNRIRKAHRDRRRQRRIAQQWVWDRVMRRPGQRRLTYLPKRDAAR